MLSLRPLCTCFVMTYLMPMLRSRSPSSLLTLTVLPPLYDVLFQCSCFTTQPLSVLHSVISQRVVWAWGSLEV
ncbi:hypothetical protein DFP72DRAFT_301946 [Ephemerocybe angulata]|uniref:Uncharacterized protein n=1 Tax=Ephemerocybe angulata TaxID=980116 RepID=A0A8H6I0G4_9AGAR|nr:hypothetical protein DFP72DRAFT_301946 [Tulosesus angulatus]